MTSAFMKNRITSFRKNMSTKKNITIVVDDHTPPKTSWVWTVPQFDDIVQRPENTNCPEYEFSKSRERRQESTPPIAFPAVIIAGMTGSISFVGSLFAGWTLFSAAALYMITSLIVFVVFLILVLFKRS